MNFLARLRAMLQLSDAGQRLATASRQAVIVEEDAERHERLGDVDGQLARATAYTAKVDALALRTRP